eukprot:15437819-Alexandrium_andersonii.AAC.2
MYNDLLLHEDALGAPSEEHLHVLSLISFSLAKRGVIHACASGRVQIAALGHALAAVADAPR